MKKTVLFLNAAALVLALGLGGCKKKDDDKPEETVTNNPPANTEKKYALVIDNGAQSIEVGMPISLNAHLVSSTGAVITPASVSWSSNIGGIIGNAFSATTPTVGIITASATHEGVTYTSSVPVNIQPAKSTMMFGVVPSAIMWSTNSGDIQLHTVYMGSQSTSYSFSSDNTNIATVSSTGNITFKAPGTTNIRVKATIGGQQQPEIIVPVMVVGTPEVPLPVTRVVVNPAVGEMFRGETLQLNAKAYNSNGDDVSSTVSFNYVIIPKKEDDDEPAIPVSINSTGLVKAEALGSAYIRVTANGITGQSEVIVNPDTVIMVQPFYVQLGGFDMSDPMNPKPGASEQVFTATTHKVDRAKYRAKDPGFLTSIANPSNLTWDLPLTGIPSIDEQFKVVTLSAKTSTSVKATKIEGKTGSTVIVAHAGALGGAASVMVMP